MANPNRLPCSRSEREDEALLHLLQPLQWSGYALRDSLGRTEAAGEALWPVLAGRPSHSCNHQTYLTWLAGSSTGTRIYFTRINIQEPQWWPSRSPGSKGLERWWGGWCQGWLPGPRPGLGKSQRKPGLCLQRSCSQLTPRRAMAQTPASRDSRGCWFPGADGSGTRGGHAEKRLLHVLPTVSNDHFLLWLPILAALGLCRWNRRRGETGGERAKVKGRRRDTPHTS